MDLKQYVNCVSIKLKFIFHQKLRIIRKKSKAGRRNGKCRGEWFLFYIGWARNLFCVEALGGRHMKEEVNWEDVSGRGIRRCKCVGFLYCLFKELQEGQCGLGWHWVFQRECWEMSYRVSDLCKSLWRPTFRLWAWWETIGRLWVGGWQDHLGMAV